MIGRTATSDDTAALRWNTVMWIIANGAHTRLVIQGIHLSPCFWLWKFCSRGHFVFFSVPHMGLQHFFNWQWAFTCYCGTKWLRKLLWIGRDSAVGIVTRYGLDGPGIESRWGVRFSALVQTALMPTHPPILVFLNRRAAARYRALASIMPSRERFSWNW